MASSTSTAAHHPTRGKPLVRHNSSFLGTIRNIVTAPLSWFGHQDGDATGAKRRRNVGQEPTERVLLNGSDGTGSRALDDDEMGDALRRSKRMRLNSPPTRVVPAEGYNDPPVAAFGRTPTNSMRRASLVPRASSAVLPSSRNSRATLSPSRRQSQIKRTMSIDPPHFVSRRDISTSSSNASFNFGMDMDNAMDTGRDTSMPPSPRPSFRMRASMTPQPQHVPARHISEPPPLNALISNPQFLHPPTHAQERAQTPTLGSLVDARASRSPVRQNHSSLLFSKTSQEEKDAPAEKALQQLDIYKTPLLPTRMRSSNGDSITGKVIPDMFKSRRSSRLVLMPDDGERGRKKHKSSVNETKPYAGEGGMKKLLARAKLEADKEEGPSSSASAETKEPSPTPAPAAVPPPPPPGSDWFTTAVSGAPSSTAGSSLRVGRQKTSRNHIQRPSKSRFSAAEEDEGDDAMEDDESTKERKMLEEAAKKVPVFQIPAGFSFAKDAPAPVTPPAELEKAKEPPISSLPFSFAKPASTSSASPTLSTSVPTLPSAPKPALFGAAPKKTDLGVPNFFANSQKIKESPIPTPPVLNFSPPASSSSTPSLFGTPAQAKDSENPFCDGEKNKTPEAKPVPSMFGGAFTAASKPSETAAAVSTSLSFGKPLADVGSVSATPATIPASPFPSIHASSDKPAITLTAATPSPFSFSKQEDKLVAVPPTPTPFSLSRAAEIQPATNTSAPSSIPFSFAKPATQPASSSGSSTPFSFGGPEPKRVEVETIAPKPLFGVAAPNPLFGEASQVPLTFGDSSKATSPLHVPAVAPPQSTPSPLGFNFGPSVPAAPAPEAPKPAFSFGTGSAASSPAAEPPKPLFGGGKAGFSFGQPAAPEKTKEASPAPFSFGTPTTPVAEAKGFSFGPTTTPTTPTVAAPASIGFSFSGGGGSASTDVSNKPAFMFGNSAQAVQPTRPATPPKGLDQEFMMEESPSREMQMNGNKGREAGQFSFGNGPSLNGGSGFGGGASVTTSAPSPFSFNTASASNPFGGKKPEEPKPFGFSAPPQAPPINTSFSFGQTKDELRPASAGAFNFGPTPASTPTTAPGFSFGGQAPAANAFGQASVASVPSSPSTFNQPFGFGAQTPTAAHASNPFGFGSQPASPAAGNVVLPPALSTSFSNGGGFGQVQSPSSPFTAPQQIAPSTSGGSLFTIGAAPAAAPSGQRVIKKMPRRGAVKR